MREAIDAAYQLFGEELAEDSIKDRLTATGCSLETAEKLVAFVPLACGRALLAGSGVSLSESYIPMDHAGQAGEPRELASDPQWVAVEEFVRRQNQSGPDTVSRIAMRSAEFDAINQALHQGSQLADLVGAPPVILLTDTGTGSARAPTPWWAFWRK